jgi:hypothetical protein
MTDQDKLNDLNNRVNKWGKHFAATGLGYNDMLHDIEFQSLIDELMAQDEDSMSILVGMAIQEAGICKTFEILDDTFNGDNKNE